MKNKTQKLKKLNDEKSIISHRTFVNVYRDDNGRYFGDEDYNSYEAAFANRDQVSTYVETVEIVRVKNPTELCLNQERVSKINEFIKTQLTMTEILAEAERRYPEQISVEGRDSDKKQRKNQRLFIEGARWMQAVWLAIEQ